MGLGRALAHCTMPIGCPPPWAAMADGDDEMEDGITAGDIRSDETLGIDRSEQPGLGGDSSVLEEYGKDTVPDDEPEKPAVEEAEREPILPGTDPEMPKDLEADAARAPPDPTLPKKGHEVQEGPSQALAGLAHKSLDPNDPAMKAEKGKPRAGASGNLEQGGLAWR